MKKIKIEVSGIGGHREGREAHRRFRNMLGISKSERFPYEFDGLKDKIAYELDWSGGSDIYKAFFKVLYYKVVIKKPLKKMEYYVRENYPDSVFNGYPYVERETQRMKPILKEHGIDLEVIPVERIIKE